MRTLPLGVLLAGILTTSGSLVGQTWVQQSPPLMPSPRYLHAMAYDSARGTIVMFGGSGSGGETWEWNGVHWTQGSPGPSRYYHAMAYDSLRSRVVMFGGNGSNSFEQSTWEWDGVNWAQRNPPASPPGRVLHAMAYDSQRRRVVMYGGTNSSGDLGDTWEWDGNQWIPRISLQFPLQRSEHAMAYDPQRRRVALFGGFSVGTGFLSDTWEWDGLNWTQRSPATSPAARDRHSMAYDSSSSRVLLFGGNSGLTGERGDTWEWDGTNWAERTPSASPPARFYAALACDSQRGRVVLFGGSSGGFVVDDTWEWGSQLVVGSTRTFGSGCGQPALTATPGAGSRPLLGTTMLTDVSNVPMGLAFMAVGFSSSSIGPFSLPLPLDGLGFTGCLLYHDAVDLWLPCTATGPSTAQHSVMVPNDPALINLAAFLQAWAPAPGANPMEIIVSNAVEVIVGNM